MKKQKPHEQAREIVVVGVDSETQQGPPISLQFYSADQPSFTAILQVTARDATRTFFRHISRHAKPDKHYRFYGHYLEFDMLSFLWQRQEKLVDNHGQFEFAYADWEITGCYGRPTFARLTRKNGALIEIVDSGLWFRGSLDMAAQQYAPDLPKLQRPAKLGERWFSVRDPEFAAYAMRDAEIADRLGHLVEGFHTQLQLRPSMSLASQAAQIFRTSYIAEPIVQCPPRYIEPAILAYHGGKNNLVPRASPAWHADAAMYDLSSAYPWAMSELPSFADPDGYSEVRFQRSHKRFPVPGIYCVTGKLAPCKWPIFFTHDFKPLQNCKIEDLWVHGYELNEAIAAGEFTPTCPITGCYYASHKPDQSAMARFAKDFYKLKAEAASPIDRYMYKILLNSISGKFIQTRASDRLDEQGRTETEWIAGGLFQPFIAGAITAHTRANMHRVEHAYKAVHTATDGIIAKYRKRRPDLNLPESGLGSLNEEMRGNVLLLRTKLYIGYDQQPGGVPSKVFENWNIRKYALHGFQGNVGELEQMVMSGRRWYTANHRIGLREAIKHGTVANNFIQRQMFLQVGKVR